MQASRTGPVPAGQTGSDRAEIERALIEILAEGLAIDPGALSAQTDLVEELGIESIELINIVAAVEERLGITLDVRSLMARRRLGQVVDHLVELRRAGG